ncbi:MAG: hypothetical protein JOZ55_01515 [Alphaproteobacteria bacterium]|nr:hypothetical protein [Alphaproteobacteria bacterium]
MHLRIAAAFAFALSASSAFADPGEDALKAIANCTNLRDDHARLACYDAAAQGAKAALAATPAVAESPRQKESWFGLPDIFGGNGSAPQTTPERFGGENLPAAPAKPGEAPPPAPEVLDSISAGVADFAIHLDGRFTLFLDNGQIWQQLPGDVDKAIFLRSGNKVVISRGFLGSYNLTLNGSGKLFKVRRVK